MSNDQTEVILMPEGRLVQGNVYEPQTKNMNGGPLTDINGNPKVQYYIGVAVDKNNPKLATFQQTIQQAAQAGWPSGEYNNPDFSWKIIDGDQAEYVTREGHKGCFIFRLTSGFPINTYRAIGAEPVSALTDPGAIKRGDYVWCAVSIKGNNGNRRKPGIYLNVYGVSLIGYGQEIVTGPDTSALFMQAGAAQVPQGASVTPIAQGVAPAMPGIPGGPAGQIIPPATGLPSMQQQPQTMPGMSGVFGQPNPNPQGQVQPNPGFLNPSPSTQVTPQGPGQPSPTGPQLTEKANGFTYEQLIGAGWTDEALRAEGIMI